MYVLQVGLFFFFLAERKRSVSPRAPPRFALFTHTLGKRRYNIKLWKTFTDCFNCLPVAALIDEKILTMHGGLSPDLQSLEQIRRVMRPTDVPDTGFYIETHPFRTPLRLALVRP